MRERKGGPVACTCDASHICIFHVCCPAKVREHQGCYLAHCTGIFAYKLHCGCARIQCSLSRSPRMRSCGRACWGVCGCVHALRACFVCVCARNALAFFHADALRMCLGCGAVSLTRSSVVACARTRTLNDFHVAGIFFGPESTHTCLCRDRRCMHACIQRGARRWRAGECLQECCAHVCVYVRAHKRAHCVCVCVCVRVCVCVVRVCVCVGGWV